MEGDGGIGGVDKPARLIIILLFGLLLLLLEEESWKIFLAFLVLSSSDSILGWGGLGGCEMT